MLGTTASTDDDGVAGEDSEDNGVLGTQASADDAGDDDAAVPTNVDAGGNAFTNFVTSPGGLGLLMAGLALIAAGVVARRRARA